MPQRTLRFQELLQRTEFAEEQPELRFVQFISGAAPPILERIVPEFVIVADKFKLEGLTTAEGVIGQCTLAESVDGIDRGLIHGAHREAQSRRDRKASGLRQRSQFFEQQSQKFVLWFLLGLIDPVQGVVQARANPPAQLFGGGIGKRHDENLADSSACQHIAQIEIADGVSLAGTGTRFDQLDPGKVELQRLLRRQHLCHCCHKTGHSAPA